MPTQEDGAKTLVERARCGDQNALGIIKLVGENARKGVPKAKTAFACIQAFINSNPTNKCNVGFGAEEENKLGVLKAAQQNSIPEVVDVLRSLPMSGSGLLIDLAIGILSNAGLWNKPRLREVDAVFDGPEKNLFRIGYSFGSDEGKMQPIRQKLPPDAIGVLCVGHCIGGARKIQLARLGQVPVSVLGPEVGWELGC